MLRGCCTLLLALSWGVQAQIGIKTQTSAVFTDEYRKSEVVLAEEDDQGGLLVVRSYESGGLSSTRGHYIEKYNPDLKLLQSKEIPVGRSNAEKFSLVFGVFTTADVLHILDIAYDLNQKAYVAHDNQVSLTDFIQNRQELFRYTKEEMSQYGDFALRDLFFSGSKQFWGLNGGGAFFYPGSSMQFFSNTSPMDGNYVSSGISLTVADDKQSFAVALDLAGKAETLKVWCFDAKAQPLFSQIFAPELSDRKYHNQALLIGPDGKSVLLLGKAYTDNTRRKEAGGKYEYLLTRFDAAGQKSGSFDTGTHFVTSLKMILNQGQVSCVGFYSDAKENRYGGVVSFQANPATLALSQIKYNPFTAQFLADKYGDKKPKELKYLSFRKVFVAGNGELVFNAEEAYTATTSTGGMTGGGMAIGGGSYTSYNYDDIVAARLSRDGDLLWARNINKSQYSSSEDDKYIGYGCTLDGNANYFFINTADDVRTLSGDRIEFKDVRKNRANLVAVKINPDGHFTYEQVLANENSAVPFMVSTSVSSGKKVYVLGRSGREKQLLKMTLP